MKFGTDTDMEIGSVNIKELVKNFTFKLCHLKEFDGYQEFDDYLTLHNLSMLLMLVVTPYLMHCSY